MRMYSLTDVRFNMKATVLNEYETHQIEVDEEGKVDVDSALEGGHYETIQDEITGALIRQWIPDQVVVTPPKTGAGTTRDRKSVV